MAMFVTSSQRGGGRAGEKSRWERTFEEWHQGGEWKNGERPSANPSEKLEQEKQKGRKNSWTLQFHLPHGLLAVRNLTSFVPFDIVPLIIS